METTELKKFVREIGDSVHSMNTIAIGLSKLKEDNCDIPDGLDISWKPKELEISKVKARSYAERSAIIYAVESFFEYLKKISENPFWNHPEINFTGDIKKTERVYVFLDQIPKVSDELKILSELACHWRNMIVHASTSKAKLANDKIGTLRQIKGYIHEKYHHFDIEFALENYENKKITLKDSSTLITILIKSARIVDEFFFEEFSLKKSIGTIKNNLNSQLDFNKITKQLDSDKKDRQIRKFISMTYPFLSDSDISEITNEIKSEL